jgi:hypothetical protein
MGPNACANARKRHCILDQHPLTIQRAACDQLARTRMDRPQHGVATLHCPHAHASMIVQVCISHAPHNSSIASNRQHGQPDATTEQQLHPRGPTRRAQGVKQRQQMVCVCVCTDPCQTASSKSGQCMRGRGTADARAQCNRHCSACTDRPRHVLQPQKLQQVAASLKSARHAGQLADTFNPINAQNGTASIAGTVHCDHSLQNSM